MPFNSTGRSRVLTFRLTNDDIEIVRHLTGTASCVSTHIAALDGRSLDRVNDDLTKRMGSLRELRTGPLAHA